MGINFKSKYKNKFVRIDGHLFHSQKEARWWLYLKSREEAKEIACLERQVRYEIYRTKDGKPRHYIADFRFMENGEEHIVDVKSNFTAKDPVFKIKKELFECKYRKNLEIWTGSPPKNWQETRHIGSAEAPSIAEPKPKKPSKAPSRGKARSPQKND